MMGGATGNTPWLMDGAGNPLAPPSVLADLKELNPRFGLWYHVGLRAFMVTEQWPEDDARRELIKTGALPEHADFSILCPVPANVSVDELRGWVQSQLVRVGESREDVKAMVAAQEARAAAANAAVLTDKTEVIKHELVEAVANPAPTHGKRRTRVK